MNIKNTILTFLVLSLMLISAKFSSVDAQTVIKPEMIFAQNDAQAEVPTDAITEKYGFDLLQELAIGRTVSYALLDKYNNRVNSNEALNGYVNLVGQSIAKAATNRPKINYKFGIIDTIDINAFACPGGYVYVTTGLLKTVSDENELAGVLAHEIGHIEHGDGLKDIKAYKDTKYANVNFDAFENAVDLTYDMASYTPYVGSYVRYYNPKNMAKREINKALWKVPGGGYAGSLGRYAASSAASSAVDVCANVLKEQAAKLGRAAYVSLYVDSLAPQIEYDADDYSVNAVSKAGYDSNGLAEFLKVVEVLSDSSAEPEESKAKSMFTYRHPPILERVEKIETTAAALDMQNEPMSENKRSVLKDRYKKNLMNLK